MVQQLSFTVRNTYRNSMAYPDGFYRFDGNDMARARNNSVRKGCAIIILGDSDMGLFCAGKPEIKIDWEAEMANSFREKNGGGFSIPIVFSHRSIKL